MLLLGLVLVLVIALIEVHVITYAYEKMGIQRRLAPSEQTGCPVHIRRSDAWPKPTAGT